VFERFSEDAKGVMVAAQKEASRLGHNYVGTEHLLLGFMAHGSGVGVEVLAEAGVDLDGARSAGLRRLGRGFHAPSPEEDRAALAAIGIDLDSVRSWIEEVFRPGALERPPASRRRRRWGITKSHSRPHTNNDNPFSESQFRTMKYRPEFPERFGCFEDAHAFCSRFFGWYNDEHRHSASDSTPPPMCTMG
jgi:hypothetical protein